MTRPRSGPGSAPPREGKANKKKATELAAKSCEHAIQVVKAQAAATSVRDQSDDAGGALIPRAEPLAALPISSRIWAS